jgi:hypothetical protein
MSLVQKIISGSLRVKLIFFRASCEEKYAGEHSKKLSDLISKCFKYSSIVSEFVERKKFVSLTGV